MDPRVEIPGAFPKIDPGFLVTSPFDFRYNCIGWAADEQRFWWPDGWNYWPIPDVREPTVERFTEAFATKGYTEASDGTLEPHIDKLAIYVDSKGFVTHMARQLEDGTWTSKLGKAWDIQHVSEHCLSNSTYGSVAKYLKRSRDFLGA
jgi:hypothetical protein